MATLTDVLGQVGAGKTVYGRYVLFRYHRDLAAAAAPITPVNVADIQNIGDSAMSYDVTEIFQFAGGDDKRTSRLGGTYTGTINMLAPGVAPFLAALLGQTWTAAGDTAVPSSAFPTHPVAHFEAVLRREDNNTHIHTKVWQEVKLLPMPSPLGMDLNMWDIQFESDYDPFYLCSGAYMVLDKFTGDGSTTVFTLSQTALDMVDATQDHLPKWDFDQAAFIKEKASGESTGTRQTSGYTISGTTLTAGTAPDSGDEVSIFYAAATA